MKKTTSLQVKKRRIRRGVLMTVCVMCLTLGIGGKAHALVGTYGDFKEQIVYTVER